MFENADEKLRKQLDFIFQTIIASSFFEANCFVEWPREGRNDFRETFSKSFVSLIVPFSTMTYSAWIKNLILEKLSGLLYMMKSVSKNFQ